MTIFNGSLSKGATQTLPTTQLSTKFTALSASLLAQYQATAATTGVKLQIGVSIDEGTTFSDWADVTPTAAPTANSASPVQSQQYYALDAYKGADALQFRLVNLDGTNNATVALELREAA